MGISADNSGNIYVTGYTNIGISGQKQTGAYDYFIAKYDAAGNLIWTKQVGNSQSDGTTLGRGIIADNSGNIYVTGSTYGNGISGQTQNGMWDYFIAKYDAAGNLIWTKQVGNSKDGLSSGNGISLDSSGNIYVVGYVATPLPGQPPTNGFGDDYFIAKHDSNGNLLWTRLVGVPGKETEGFGVSADKFGNIYITGYTNIGISGQKQTGNHDYFIAKYDVNGNLIWTKQVGAAVGNTYGTGISADNFGNIYITGYTTRGLSGQTQNGIWDYFIARYDAYGNLLAATQNGAAGGDTRGFGISADNLGNVYISGGTTAGLSGLTQNGYQDYVAVKYMSTN